MAEMNTDRKTGSFQAFLLLTIVSVFWFSQYVYMPYQATYLSAAGIGSSWVGIVIGAYGFSQLVLRMPVGLMADRRGRHKPFIMLGIISAGSASLIRVFSPNGWGFLVANLLSGLASAMWISFMVLFFSYFHKEKMQKASGMVVAANNFGILLGFVTATLLHEHFGMRLLCILSAAAAVPAFFLAMLIREPDIEFESLPVRDLISVYSDKRLLVFSLLALVQQGVQLSTSMSFTTQVALSRGAESWQIGLCSIIYILTAVISSYFAASRTALKRGARFWIPVIMVCLAAYCILIPNLPSVEWIYFAQMLSGFSTGILFSFCASEAMKNIPKEKRSTAMGFFQAVYAVGMTTFPMLTGAITQVSDIRTAFYSLAGIIAVGFAGAVFFYRPRRNVSENN